MILINILAIIGVVVGLIAVGVAIVAAADPEGRGGNYILGGLAGLIVVVVCAVWLIGVAIGRWLA